MLIVLLFWRLYISSQMKVRLARELHKEMRSAEGVASTSATRKAVARR